MQKESFLNEIKILTLGKLIKNGPYDKLKLYLDLFDIIRCQERLNVPSFTNTNTSILFPARHPLLILYILNLHRCCNCSGVAGTLNIVRKRIHYSKLRRIVAEVVKKCLICQKIMARPYKQPEHPPLEPYRLKCQRPFSMCGCDYAGPFKAVPVNEEGITDTTCRRNSINIYVTLFTCLVKKSHLLNFNSKQINRVIPHSSERAFGKVYRAKGSHIR